MYPKITLKKYSQSQHLNLTDFVKEIKEKVSDYFNTATTTTKSS
jgi:hypothetical protein